jgi:hypothetical protein
MVARLVQAVALCTIIVMALLVAPSHAGVPPGASVSAASRTLAPPPPPCGERSPVALNPTAGPAGTPVTASGCGWTPGSQLALFWDNEDLLTTTMVNPDGTFTTFFVVPEEDADEELHQVVVLQSCGMGCVSRFAQATFTVTE